MTIGEKIRKFRTEKNLSQKQLSVMSGMSEPAIRNYELGNRTPSEKRLDHIAQALGVSRFALSDPDLDSYVGMMHALFYLEDNYGLEVAKIEDQICLRFENPVGTANTNLCAWYEEFSSFKDEKISREEYDAWRHTYPAMKAKKDMAAIRKARQKSK
ncbi:MAG: helix-turn-helix transcriptional regulator [Christensenella sp.]|uniref:helix-turn-helix domain-containing protein n=1 Tax=Christensenella sp. TaxID=1935934 RepID=UPI002B21B2DC|nr:helix-turn-helix transcriptional regulator [Christensenella sp.]MEA5004727.1 helix-turn-helix transcriptional regulator [Christensenella sp.]